MSLESPSEGRIERLYGRRTSLREWRAGRPFAGGVLLCLAGLAIAWVPLQFAFELMLVGGGYTYIGLVWALGVFLAGAFALQRPDLSNILGVVGIALSILSLLGALGGLLVGMVLGILGGSLCVAWEPNGDRDGTEESGDASDDGDESEGSGDPTDADGNGDDGVTDADDRPDVVGGFRFGGDGRNGADRDPPRRGAGSPRGGDDGAGGRGGGPDARDEDGGRNVGEDGSRLALALAALVVTAATVTLVTTGPAAAILGDREGTTYTVAVDEIKLGEDGRICARAVGPETYRVTLYDATLVDATIYQQSGTETVKSEFPSLQVAEPMVMYTTAQEDGLALLSRTVGCTTEDQTSRTVFRNRYQTSSLLRGADGVTMLHLGPVEGAVPEPGGFSFAPSADDNRTAPGDGVRDLVDGLDDAVADREAPVPAVDDNGTANGTDDVTGASPPTEPVGNVTDALFERADDTLPIPRDALGLLERTVDGVASTGDDVVATDRIGGIPGQVGGSPSTFGNASGTASTLGNATGGTPTVPNATGGTQTLANTVGDVANETATLPNQTLGLSEDVVAPDALGSTAAVGSNGTALGTADGTVDDTDGAPADGDGASRDGRTANTDERSGSNDRAEPTGSESSPSGDESSTSTDDEPSTPNDDATDSAEDGTEAPEADPVDVGESVVEEAGDLTDATTDGVETVAGDASNGSVV